MFSAAKNSLYRQFAHQLRQEKIRSLRKKILSPLEIFLHPMFFPLYNGLKKRREPCVLGLSPLCYYKDTTFSAEIQIALTYRNSLRNVKRRVLHTRGFAMCYITRDRFSGGLLLARKPPAAHCVSLDNTGRAAPLRSLPWTQNQKNRQNGLAEKHFFVLLPSEIARWKEPTWRYT